MVRVTFENVEGRKSYSRVRDSMGLQLGCALGGTYVCDFVVEESVCVSTHSVHFDNRNTYEVKNSA
jgi:hypothetical protein